MSYILNALKKAEHDRKRDESEDLDDFVSAGWDPYQEPPKRVASYKLAIIIVAIAALLFVGFYSLNFGPQQSAEVLDTEAPTEQGVEQVPEQGVKQQVAPENQPAIEEFVEEPVAEELVVEELQLPEVTIAGHIYIRSGSVKNRIFIGDKTYYVGDSIDGDWVIESINFDSLSISSGALSSELPLR
jgi:hypothetical protein